MKRLILILYIFFLTTFAYSQPFWDFEPIPGGKALAITRGPQALYTLVDNDGIYKYNDLSSNWERIIDLAGELVGRRINAYYSDSVSIEIIAGDAWLSFNLKDESFNSTQLVNIPFESEITSVTPFLDKMFVSTNVGKILSFTRENTNLQQEYELANHNIFTLYNSRNQLLVAGTDSGLYSSTSGVSFMKEISFGNRPVYKMTGNKIGQCMLFDGNQVIYFHDTNLASPFFTTFNFAGFKCTSHLMDENSETYIGFLGNGCYSGLYNNDQWINISGNIPNPYVLAISKDPVRDLLLTSVEDFGILSDINGNWNPFSSGIDALYIKDIAEGISDAGDRWYFLASDRRILAKNISQEQDWIDLYLNSNQFVAQVTAIEYVGGDSLFIGTDGNGLFLMLDLGQTLFKDTTYPFDGIIRDMVRLPNGDIIVASTNNGIYRYKAENKTWANVLAGSPFFTLFVDQNTGEVYAGGYSQYFVSADGGVNWDQFNLGVAAKITAIFVDRMETVYFGTEDKGVYRLIQGGSIEELSYNLPQNTIYDIIGNDNDEIIVSLDDENGLFQLDPGVSQYVQLNPPQIIYPTALHLDAGGDLLVGSKIRGLAMYRNWKFGDVSARPTNVKAFSTFNEVNLTWEKAPSPDFKYYKIYGRQGNGMFSVMDSTGAGDPLDTLKLIEGLNSNTEYSFYVTAMQWSGIESPPSDTIVIRTKTPTVPSPTLMALFPLGGSGAMEIRWSKSDLLNFSHYRLYWGISPNLLFNTAEFGVQASDTVALLENLRENREFFVAVTVVDDAGNESGFSNLRKRNPFKPAVFLSGNKAVFTDSLIVESQIAPAGQSLQSIHLEVSNSKAFSNFVSFTGPVVNSSDAAILVNPIVVKPLASNTKYYYRAVAEWGSTGAFLTVASKIDSAITLPPTVGNLSPADQATDQPINPTLSWDEVLGEPVIYHVQVATVSSFTQDIVFQDFGVATNSVSIEGLDFSRQYYWRVRAVNESGPGEWSQVHSFTTRRALPATIQAEQTFNFQEKDQNQYTPEDYQIVGIPGKANNQLITTMLSGVQDYDWRVFWDNGTNTSEYLVPFDGTATFHLGDGKAFWLISNRDQSVSLSVPPPDIQKVDTVYFSTIPVHSGWNLITSPFPFDVSWSDIKRANNIPDVAVLWGYNKGYYQSGQLREYEGYYFDNTYGINELRIPFTLSRSKFSKPVSGIEEFCDWAVRLVASREDRVIGSIVMGVSGDAGEGMDAMDIRKPGHPQHHFDIFFTMEGDTTTRGMYYSNIQDITEDMQQWHFEVHGEPGQEITLQWDATNLPPNRKLILINEATVQVTDMNVTSEYRFTLVGSGMKFKIYTGKDEDVDELADDYLPTRFELKQNYPNPFNPLTTIPVSVPEEAHVDLAVYDILGRKIKTLYSGYLAPGIHYFNWDGTNSLNLPLTSGIYIYQLKINNSQIFTKKMIFMK
ncbi:MAG: hypothetical protein Kow00108_14650 [Calditrichia bacterium]